MKTLKTKLKHWLVRRSESCREISPLFSAALDRRLTRREKLRVKIHLFICSACFNYISNLRFMREVFQAQEKNFQNEKLHVSLSPEAREKIKNALKSSRS